MSFEFYGFSSLPVNGVDVGRLFEAIGGIGFVVVYDLLNGLTLMGFDSLVAKNKILELEKVSLGTRLEPTQYQLLVEPQPVSVISFYRQAEEPREHLMDDIFNIVHNGFLAVVFVPVGKRELEEAKKYIEERLSARNVKEAYSVSKGSFAPRFSVTSHRDLFIGSEEAMLFGSVLESINNAILSNGLVYKPFFVTRSDSDRIHDFIGARFLVLDKAKCTKGLGALLDDLKSRKSLPLGASSLQYLVSLSGSHRLSYTLPTITPAIKGGMDVGTFMRGGVELTNTSVSIEPSTLNLGFIITGLPGTGKTTEAMAIIDSLLKAEAASKLKIAVITPTDEWNSFALAHGMCLVRLYRDSVPINFFRRPEGIDSERFYENLAMVLSSASNAGPYQNPMEKCMLNAFRRVYANESEPDPVAVYDEIENAIAMLHAKRTNAGIKYTKHGENIRSALENLRGILSRPEFCATKGVKIEDMLERGVVFDISNASGTTRAYLYALLLNQVYAVASELDTNGDDELRLLICLEEAQTMFGARDSAAVEDMRQRIQDFRKQGIGLMLLAHNVGDIDAGIRRLCQSKLYLKQASDMAALAEKDLVFTYAKDDEVILKMKLLDSRIGALTYVTKEGRDKFTQDTIFIRTKNYENRATSFENPIGELLNGLELPAEISATIYMDFNPEDKLAASPRAIRFIYLGEAIAEHLLEGAKSVRQTLVSGKTYKLQVLDRRGKVSREFAIRGEPEVRIKVA